MVQEARRLWAAHSWHGVGCLPTPLALASPSLGLPCGRGDNPPWGLASSVSDLTSPHSRESS